MRRGLFALLALGIMLSACRRERESVVARVGKATITESEFARKLAEVTPDYQNYVVTPHGRRQFLDVIIREKLVLQAARADGIAASPEFKDRMRKLRKEEERKLSEARDYLLSRLWIDKLRAQSVLKVSEQDIQDFYKKHPAEVTARHILLPTAEEAEVILRRIRRGASFAALAKKKSLDADTAALGGRMRPALYGETIPELTVIYKMRLHEVGGPVRSKFGYHVLLKESARKPPLKNIKDRIRNIIEKDKLDKHLESLRTSFPVEVVDAQFK